MELVPDPPQEKDDPFAVSDEEAERIATSVEVQVPIKTLMLDGAAFQVAKDPSGERAILIGPVALNLVVPLTAENARQLATELTGGIVIAGADSMPTPQG